MYCPSLQSMLKLIGFLLRLGPYKKFFSIMGSGPIKIPSGLTESLNIIHNNGRT